MPWYGEWGWGPWLIFPILMCIAMMAMMLLMARGRMGWCGGGHAREARIDPALESLRQRLASGDLTPQEYEEQRNLLLTT
jgi:uncharacterized membrane protein